MNKLDVSGAGTEGRANLTVSGTEGGRQLPAEIGALGSGPTALGWNED